MILWGVSGVVVVLYAYVWGSESMYLQPFVVFLVLVKPAGRVVPPASVVIAFFGRSFLYFLLF